MDTVPRLQHEIARLANTLRTISCLNSLTHARELAQDALHGYTFPAAQPALPKLPLSYDASIAYLPGQGYYVASQDSTHYLSKCHQWTTSLRTVLRLDMTIASTVRGLEYFHPTRKEAEQHLAEHQETDIQAQALNAAYDASHKDSPPPLAQ